jgi:chorismate mutase/prephenate dehydratase
VVSVTNRPGAVHDLLVPLKNHGVSMTRFESRPARSGQWEYYFYIDIEGHPDEPRVAAALRSCAQACEFFKVLGTYPADTDAAATAHLSRLHCNPAGGVGRLDPALPA